MESWLRRPDHLVALLGALALYLACVFLCWNWLTWSRPRHTLGEACWPEGFTSDGRHAVTYKRWWRWLPAGGGGEESTGPVQVWDLHSCSLVASFLCEKRHPHSVELSSNNYCTAIQEGNDPT